MRLSVQQPSGTVTARMVSVPWTATEFHHPERLKDYARPVPVARRTLVANIPAMMGGAGTFTSSTAAMMSGLRHPEQGRPKPPLSKSGVAQRFLHHGHPATILDHRQE